MIGRRAAVASAALVAATLACRDGAALERQHHLGLGGGLSILKVDDKSTTSVGAGGALHYTYGLSDAFNLMAEFSSSIVALDERLDTPETPRTRPAAVDTLGAGLAYTIDVTRLVPYIGVLASGSRLSGGTLEKPALPLGVQLAAGVDYPVTSHLTLGFAFRQHLMLTDLGTYPSFTNFFFRVGFVWGN